MILYSINCLETKFLLTWRKKNEANISELLHDQASSQDFSFCSSEVDRRRRYRSLKAMLHEAIFLATCLVTMTTEKHCKLQRGCHTFAIFFRNLQRPRWKLLTTLSPPA